MGGAHIWAGNCVLTIQQLEEAILVSMFQTQRLDFRNVAAQSNLFCSQGQTKTYRDSRLALESHGRESRRPRGQASNRSASGSKQSSSLWPEKTFCLGDFGQHFNRTPGAALSF